MWKTAWGVIAIVAGATSASAQDLRAGGGFAAQGIVQCQTDLRQLNQLSGWQVRWPEEWDGLRQASDDEVRNAIRRWRTAQAVLHADMMALKSTGVARAPRAVVRRVLSQLNALVRDIRNEAPPLRPDVAPDLRQSWETLFANSIRPAIGEYRAFLKDQYKPAADFGLARIPEGADCFRRAVATFSTLDLPVSTIEQIGWSRLRAAEDELLSLHGLERRALPTLLLQLRRPEPAFTTGKLMDLSERAVRRAVVATPRMFNRTEVAPIEVRAIPKRMEASFPAAAYHGSHSADEVAVFAINLSRPAERRLSAEAIVFHETIPGHHASEGLGYPRGGPSSGFLEGWGMYAEQLAGEMGLYSGTRDRAGMLARRIAAAVRPIVETGLHAKGWPRSRAVEFMQAHTALGAADIELEVDRMLAGPGQPSSYIIGYDRFAILRRDAEGALGKAFSLRDFHDQILRGGARPLPALQADIERWIRTSL